jgi:hypothetical protein
MLFHPGRVPRTHCQPPLLIPSLFLLVFSALFFHPIPEPLVRYSDPTAELRAAATFLNLPTWIQKYNFCMPAPCEVVLQAHHFFKEYAPTLTRDPSPGSLISWIWEGMGNHMWGDTIGFTFAAMLNTTLTVYMPRPFQPNVYEYVPGVKYASQIAEFSNWSTAQLFRSHDVPIVTNSLLRRLRKHYLIARFTYPLFAYLQPVFGERLYRVFGDYAFYFMTNYLVRFPGDLMEMVFGVTARLPPRTKLYGFHLRWNKDSEMFIGTVAKGLACVKSVVEDAIKRNYLLVIASDSGPLVKGFVNIAGDPRRIVRGPQFPRNSSSVRFNPLLDMILVMYCRRYVLTLRSTFSSIIAQRSGRTPLWVCNFMTHLFAYSNSQISWQTLMYYDDDYFCPNRMVRVRAENERHMRRFFLHFGV